MKETNMPTPYMLEHRRRPYAYDTYTGDAPCLSSLRFEIGDFGLKDESGNALLVLWLHPVFDGTLHETRQSYEE